MYDQAMELRDFRYNQMSYYEMIKLYFECGSRWKADKTIWHAKENKFPAHSLKQRFQITKFDLWKKYIKTNFFAFDYFFFFSQTS